jgi:hypothetical protein
MGKTLGGMLAFLCLASTLVMAQGHGQQMLCLQVDGKGNCTAGAGPDGKAIVVIGERVDKGDLMTCVDKGYMVACEKL